MSNTTAISTVGSVVKDLKKNFVGKNDFGLNWQSEAGFAMQQLRKDYPLKIALDNPDSVKAAVTNIAAIGLSLNPVNAHAYLVPRGGAICLDISYRGMIKLATDAGVISWAKAALVYENDEFNLTSIVAEPEHKFDPFDDKRGNVVGAYCVAKTTGGDFLTESMSIKELNEIRDKSKAKDGPWKEFTNEMYKKTVIKRASKTWPYSSGRARLDAAVKLAHENEGFEEAVIVADEYTHSPEDYVQFMTIVESGDAYQLAVYKRQKTNELFGGLSGRYLNTAAPRKKGELTASFYALIDDGDVVINEAIEQLEAAYHADDEDLCREVLTECPEVLDFMRGESYRWARKVPVE